MKLGDLVLSETSCFIIVVPYRRIVNVRGEREEEMEEEVNIPNRSFPRYISTGCLY
jgi:hypothetical protein